MRQPRPIIALLVGLGAVIAAAAPALADPMPDFTIVRVDAPKSLRLGEGGTFRIIVGNIGDAVGPIDVLIAFKGLDQPDRVTADSGLACQASKQQDEFSGIFCAGGQLEPKRSASIVFHARGIIAGPGEFIILANMSKSTAEYDFKNNFKRLFVPVQ